MRPATTAILGLLLFSAARLSSAAAIPSFKVQEIDKSLAIGYAVNLVDVNADGKPDVVVVDKDRVIWFENPTWKLRTIMSGQKALDNVCLDAYDIDGDGQVDVALGAGWKPGNTKQPSTLQWYRRGKTLDEPWQEHVIRYDQPTLHRMRWVDVDGTGGKKALVTVPLTGAGSTSGKNWAEAGVKIEARRIPQDPTQKDWPTELISDAFHVPHNFQAVNVSGEKRPEILVASYEGVSLLAKTGGDKWEAVKLGEGDQADPMKNRGSSEIKLGKLKSGARYIATIEPWHGNQVVVYTQAAGEKNWTRRVLDNQLMWGHAVSVSDLDGDGDEELVIGVRDPLPGKAKPGARVYKAADANGEKWDKSELDPGGVAVEDLTVGDLNGDGKPDIVAVGRQTKNVKVYWNEGK